MRPEIKVSIAAKMEHAPKLAALKLDGFHLSSRWIHMAEAARQRMVPVTHWQQENFDDIAMAHFHILYIEAGDDLKGAAWETGWACGRGKRIWIAGEGAGVSMPIYPGAVAADTGGDGEEVPSIRLPNRKVVPWGLYRQQVRIVLTLEQAFKEINSVINSAWLIDSNGGEVPHPNFFNL